MPSAVPRDARSEDEARRRARTDVSVPQAFAMTEEERAPWLAEEEGGSDDEEEEHVPGERYLTEGALRALVRLVHTHGARDWDILATHISKEPRADRAEVTVDGNDGQARLYTAQQVRRAWAVLTAPVRAMPGTKEAAAAPKNPFLPTWYSIEDKCLLAQLNAVLVAPSQQGRPQVKSVEDLDWQGIADRMNRQVARQLKENGLDGQHPPRSAAAVRERACFALDATHPWLAHEATSSSTIG